MACLSALSAAVALLAVPKKLVLSMGQDSTSFLAAHHVGQVPRSSSRKMGSNVRRTNVEKSRMKEKPGDV